MIKVVKKYFIPNEENEYKPHIMRRASVGILAFVAVLIFFAGILQTEVIRKTNFLSAVIPDTLVVLANNDRVQNQINELRVNDTLVAAAQAKANDMASRSYFAHNSPDGKTPWYWFSLAGYNYQYAGENLAVNFTDSADVNQAWMKSPGHRENILNGKFTEVGIATAKGFYNGQETIFVVQMFGRPRVKTAILPKTTTTAPSQTSVPTQPNITSKEVVLAQSTSSTSTSLVAPVTQKVLSESETFIAVEDGASPELDSNSNPVSSPVKTPWIVKVLTSPNKTTNILYIALGAFILISLLLMIFIEIKKQHPKNIIFGIGLLALITALAYIYRAYILTHVIIA